MELSLRAAVFWRRGSPLAGQGIASPGKERRVRNDKGEIDPLSRDFVKALRQ
jgi:hypothetical protein